MEEQPQYCKILIKRKIEGPPGPPAPGVLKHGELAFDETGNTLYIQTSAEPRVF